MENTPENKAKFFAQYYGQKVLNYGLKELTVLTYAYLDYEDIADNYLELKPLSSINDEDAIDCQRIMYGSDFTKEIFSVLSKEKALFEIRLSAQNSNYYSDCLRSKDYALPWMGLSVDKLIEYGWIKLK